AALFMLIFSLFCWIAFGFVNALLGFVVLTGRRAGSISPFAGHALELPHGRTAILLPVYNEDFDQVGGRISRMTTMIERAGAAGLFDLFVLSDTQDPAIAAAEVQAFAALPSRAAPGPGLHYRRRPSNAGRKVGNLAEFCTNAGVQYDYMIVLDADSLMGAGTIGTLIGLMDANERVGIVQTVPYPVGRETLFARIQQFSARIYTPMLVEGLTFWQEGDGNYWGHNAIVRIAPFVAHCGLPVLPGREPFGGEILCHDVVEAGMMRAAGWDVWVLPEALESYEALPANMVDFANRERRWCQGNLQHVGLLRHPGLRPVGRFHLAYGVMHYLAGPLAVAFMGLLTLDAVLGGEFVPAVLLGTGPGFWLLAALGLGLLYGGKLLCVGVALADSRVARSYGGRVNLLASAALEQAASLGLSMMLQVFYTRYVAALLLGHTVRWDAQPRDDRGISWNEGWLRFRGVLGVGVAWLAILAVSDAVLLAWCLPLLAGLLMALPMAVLSSRIGAGATLFMTPEETAPPAILRAHYRALAGGLPPDRVRVVPPVLQLAPSSADGD
ncbi:MAG: glucans biosynthesis glucosyltransferase MdoH, partial [Gemmatimonadaceae bacterium]|nr:glucans biosynthesis glucosyltransferase MdoH [Acetobacteraceae bacterium]